MLADAGPACVLTQARAAPRRRWSDGAAGPGAALDERDWTRRLAGRDRRRRPAALATSCPEHLAYVIYTSGSTGRPKGAINRMRHRATACSWMQEAYGLDGDDRVLQKTPFSFDVSVWEFFWPLMSGRAAGGGAPGRAPRSGLSGRDDRRRGRDDGALRAVDAARVPASAGLDRLRRRCGA